VPKLIKGKKMKILISFIGNRDAEALKKNENGPILSILEKRKFDCLYLLFNSDNYWTAMLELQAYCNQYYPQMKVEFREAKSIDPIHYNLIYPAMYQVADKIQKEHPNAAITISVTSGTPTMHACWVLLVFGGVVKAELIQVSKQSGISEITFRLDDFPSISQVDEIKTQLTRLSRENEVLRQNIDINSALEHGFYIPDEGLDLDEKVIPAYYKGALRKTNGNAAQAAKLLKLKPHTFRKRMRKLSES
jgi:hypothetical protein